MTGHDDAFDVALISGYLDGELTQGDAQRVRLHLEDCAECQRTVDELARVHEVTRTTAFVVPDDTQWDETPRSTASRIFRDSGLFLAIVWVAGVVAYLVWAIVNDAESTRFEALIAVAFVSALVLIVLSALIDRLRVRRNDPYRKVLK